MNKKLENPDNDQIKSLYDYELNCEHLFVTLGSKGAVYHDGQIFCRQNSFPSVIVDTIGAGDAFFGFSCLVSALNSKLPVENSIFIPALAASLTTTWLCNEHRVTKEKLLAYATEFL